MKRRYRALRLIAVIYKILGAIVALFAVIGILFLCFGMTLAREAMSQNGINPAFLGSPAGLAGGLVGGIFLLIYGGLIALFLYAFGEGIYLLLALEENTRMTATLLQENKQSAALPPSTTTTPTSLPQA